MPLLGAQAFDLIVQWYDWIAEWVGGVYTVARAHLAHVSKNTSDSSDGMGISFMILKVGWLWLSVAIFPPQTLYHGSAKSCVNRAKVRSTYVSCIFKILLHFLNNIFTRCLLSVRFTEGTVTYLEEENGCYTGIQYKDKHSGKIQVSQKTTSIHSSLYDLVW